MITIDKINIIYNNNYLKKYLNTVGFDLSKNKKMIGVTLSKNDNFILKFYLDLTSTNEIKNIGCFKPLYDKLKSKIDYKTPTSLATGFKINNNNEWLDYIHFKFARNMILNPKSAKLKFIGINECKFGASVEKTFKQRVLKKYFYYSSNRDKELIKKLFNYNLDIKDVHHFEVYETRDNLKVNIIYDFFKNDISFIKENNLEYFLPNICVFNTFFNKEPKYYGLDKNKNLSFYYSFTEAH